MITHYFGLIFAALVLVWLLVFLAMLVLLVFKEPRYTWGVRVCQACAWPVFFGLALVLLFEAWRERGRKVLGQR